LERGNNFSLFRVLLSPDFRFLLYRVRTRILYHSLPLPSALISGVFRVRGIPWIGIFEIILSSDSPTAMQGRLFKLVLVDNEIFLVATKQIKGEMREFCTLQDIVADPSAPIRRTIAQ